MNMNKKIKKILEKSVNEEPNAFMEEHKQKIVLFAKSPHIATLDYLSMRLVASFYLQKYCKLFWYNPNENNFYLILDYLFYYFSSYIVYFSDSNRKNELVNQVGLASAFLGVLTFFQKKESDIMLCILIERIDDVLKSDFPYVYYQDTILQESIVMYDKYYNKNNSHLLNIYAKKEFNSIYAKLIDNICTDDTNLLNQLIDDICIYHLRKCNDNNFSKNEFYFTEWQLIPTEIIVLLRYRYIQGKCINFIANELIKDFIPFLTAKAFTLSEETSLFKDKLYNTYLNKAIKSLNNSKVMDILNL